MKYTVASIAALFLCTCSVLPIVAAAQTATSTNDGSSESRSVRQGRIRGYRQQSSELQQKISSLPTASTTIVAIPVLFGVAVKDLSPNFGDPRDGGARTHEGEDIMATKGTPIVSPTAAVVLRVGVGASEGSYVYTANPGGETFVYMHLDRIGEGVTSGSTLNQGSLIGYVGNTGNAAGGPAHLHFEIHSASGMPTDPFPRLTGEFSPQDKITYLTNILAQTTDAAALSSFLVTNFRSTLEAARTASLPLPALILSSLANIPVYATPLSGAVPLPNGDLDLDSSGAPVTTLQTYLIQEKAGPAAIHLASAGATGYFGAITKAAVLEYQVANSITPANGYYGASTRTYIASHPITLIQAPTVPSVPLATTSNRISTLTVDLHYGSNSEGVHVLQQFLNTHGFMVATNGSGSPGNETTYFGLATEAAVIKFQLAHHISPAAGYVGPLTRAAFVVA